MFASIMKTITIAIGKVKYAISFRTVRVCRICNPIKTMIKKVLSDFDGKVSYLGS